MGRYLLIVAVILGSSRVVADDSSVVQPGTASSGPGTGSLVLPPPGNGVWSPPQPIVAPSASSLGYPSLVAESQPVQKTVCPIPTERPILSTWYTRADYFHWNERIYGTDFVNESGPLFTLGYQRRVGRERFRVELFGGDVNYDGAGQFEDHDEPLSSTTRYLGVRGEYELLLEPAWMPRQTFFLGIGTRFWIRDLVDGYTIYDNYVMGYQETWWTIYPYVGMESRLPLGSLELYSSTRFGVTPLTYEHAAIYPEAVLYPRCGITAAAELGLRGPIFSLSGYFEAMTWSQSAVVRDVLQPDSRMYTVGLRAACSF